MAAKDMAARGEKTRAKVLKALGKKPKSAAEVAKKVGVSVGFARDILHDYVNFKKAVETKKGNTRMFALPPAQSVAGVTHSETTK